MRRLRKNKEAISRVTAIVIVVVIVIAAIAIGFALSRHPTTTTTTTTTSTTTTTTTISFTPNLQVVAQGTPVTFIVSGTSPGEVVSFYTGDGRSFNVSASASTTSYTYTYPNPGVYLAYVAVYSSGKLVGTTSTQAQQILVNPNPPQNIVPYISVPLIYFNSTRNPNAPVFGVGEKIYLYGGFHELPSNPNFSIYEYIWNISGQVQTIPANPNTSEPSTNPVSTSFSSPGLYPVSLTIVTKNANTGQTYSQSVTYTLAVSAPSLPFGLYKFNGQVPDPNVINVVENVAGGPYSFDPSVDYESVGFEVISNIFATLVIYNGSSTTSFIPFAADYWSISSNSTVYTFHIRAGLRFSNGQPLTAYDVWYSVIRTILFAGGSPGTAGWILTKYLIPNYTPFSFVMSSPNDTKDFNEIMHAVTYDNQTNTVTFHLVQPTPAQLFFTAVADPLGAGIQDAAWLESIGAGINFTPAGFYAYQQHANEGDYFTQVQNDPVASGPYMIEQYVPGQSIILVPNPYYPGVPGIPKPNTTVYIQWVKDPATAYNLFATGQADIVTGLPTVPYIGEVEQSLIPKHLATMYEFPTLSEFFFVFNINVNTTLMQKDFGSQFHMPSDYFANLYVRKAFAYAFNYTQYLDYIVGNKLYNIQFASGYAGVIIPGLPYYTPPSEFTGVPYYNLSYATQLMKQSGLYNVSVNIPIIISTGDTVDYEAAIMWAQALHQMDPNIQASPVYVPFSQEIAYEVPGQNPMPLYYLGWIADYPYPSDFVDAMYEVGGTYPAPDGWTVQYLQSLNYTQEAQMYQELNSLIAQADAATNPQLAQQLYKQAEQIAINLYMYVYTQQPNAFWVVKPYMTGYQGQISYEENPMIGGAGDSLYFWWVK